MKLTGLTCAGLFILACCGSANEAVGIAVPDPTICYTSPSALDYNAELVLNACDHLLADPEQLSSNELFEIYFSRGLTKREMGDLEGSKSDLLDAVELGAESDDAVRMLAWTFREMGEYQQSVELYNKAIDMAPDNWQGYLSRCVVLGYGLEDYKMALEDCQKALELGRASEDVIYFTSNLLNLLGSHDDAFELIDEYSNKDTVSARVYEEYILALVGLEDKLRAERALKAAQIEFPADTRWKDLAVSVGQL